MARPIAVILFLFFSLFTVERVNAQCSNCVAQYPAGIQSTTSTSLTTVNTCVFGGEYSVYNVTAGQTYTWTTCGGATWDTQLTLYAGAGGCVGASLAYNDDNCGLQSTITWTANFTGQVSLLLSQFFCQSNFSCATLFWACTTCGTTGGGSNYNNPGGTISACSGNFYDSGGAAGAYGTNQSIVTTICPTTSGQCVSVNFSLFDLESGWDFLRIYNGTSTAAPIIGTYSGTQLAGQSITATSANASGCLTFWFTSDGSVNYTGWAASISCVNCGTVPPPPPPSAQDCAGASTICSSDTFSGNSSGPGNQELNFANQGCLAYENQTSWFFFSPTTTGTIAFMLNPTPLVDYDFAIWGPYPDPVCPPPGPPLRCSFAAPAVPTGLQSGAGDNTEGAGGNGVVNPIVVGPAEVGMVYVMLIDNWSASTTPYNFVWNNTGVVLDCQPILVLPVELIEFYGYHRTGSNHLHWRTATEINSDYFTVERAGADFNFEAIGTIAAAGITSIEQHYEFKDDKPTESTHYYRLRQVDYNGQSETYNIISISKDDSELIVRAPYPNPLTGEDLNLELSIQRQQLITIKVYDTTGREVIRKSSQLARGAHQIQLDFTGIPRGSYQLMIANDQDANIHTARIIR
jgi:hypothetical protein